MNGFLIFVMILFFGGIVVLSLKSSNRKKTREQFLEELARFLDGKTEAIEDEAYVDSFRICFKFSGEQFIYEDVLTTGFKEKINKGYMKVKIPNKTTVRFEAKKALMKIKKDIFLASEVSTQSEQVTYKVQIPKQFEDFGVYADDPMIANSLFEDKKIAGIFNDYKNKDRFGHSFIAMAVIDGFVVLEFYPEEIFYPSLISLYKDVPSIDNHLNKMMTIFHKFKKFPHSL